MPEAVRASDLRVGDLVPLEGRTAEIAAPPARMGQWGYEVAVRYLDGGTEVLYFDYADTVEGVDRAALSRGEK